MSKYTEKSLAYVRKAGYRAQTVERWQSRFWKPEEEKKGPPGRRIDLFGIIDIVGLKGCIIGVQSGPISTRREHLRTLMETQAEASNAWLRARGRLVLISWRRTLMKNGGTAFRYTPEIDEVVIGEAGGLELRSWGDGRVVDDLGSGGTDEGVKLSQESLEGA